MKALNSHFIMTFVLSLLCIYSFSQEVRYVSSASDSGDGSLRSILLQCNSGDTIMFNSDIDTVTLTSGELIVSKSISIIGKQEMTVLKRSNDTLAFRIMEIISDDTLDVLIENLVITGGKAPAGTVGSPGGENGGGIYIGQDNHKLYLKKCIITGNKAGDGYCQYFDVGGNGGDGGGIFSNSFISLFGCEVKSNVAGVGCDYRLGDWDLFQAYGTNGGNGGGIYTGNDIELLHCDFLSNHTSTGARAVGHGHYCNRSQGGDGGSGGGLYCYNSKTSITGCIFMSNTTGNGGAGNNQYVGVGGDGGNGGAVFFENSYVFIDSTSFSTNKTGNGGQGSGGTSARSGDGGYGGAIYFAKKEIDIRNSIITSNTCGSANNYGEYCSRGGNGGSGGGAYLKGDAINIDRTQFRFNVAGNGAYCFGQGSGSGSNGGNGGGLAIDSVKNYLVVSSSEILGNFAGDGGYKYSTEPPSSGYNGGEGGGICFHNNSSPAIISNSLISRNSSGKSYLLTGINYPMGNYPYAGCGGGIFIRNTTVQLTNVTCTANKTAISVWDGIPITLNDSIFENVLGLGGGIYAPDTGLFILNSIISDNTIADTLVDNDMAVLAWVDYSLVRDSSRCDISGGNNIFNTDPVFTNFPDSLTLTIFSPGVNAGNPDTSFLGLPPTDLAGNPRIFNGIIDMGAYELQEVNYYQSLLINVSPVKFDSVAPGSSSGEEVSIINDGTLPVTIDYISCHSPFALWDAENMVWIDSLNQFTIMPGEPGNRFILQLSFNPQTTGYYTDSLSIMSDLGLTKIQLSGVCGFEEIDEYKPQMAIFPNPADHSINIMFKKPLSEDVSIQLFNQLGRQVNLPDIKELSGKSKINISVRDLPGGIYFIRLLQEEVIAEAKIIIMH